MLRAVCLVAAVAATAVAATAGAATPVPLDGSNFDVKYGTPLFVQDLGTGFGNSTRGDPDIANGSELDNVFASIVGSSLHIGCGGNLETNFNNLLIFLDVKQGGQNTLSNSNPNINFDNLNINAAGLTFDSDFAADYVINYTNGIGGGGAVEHYLSAAALYSGGTGEGGFVFGGDKSVFPICAGVAGGTLVGVTSNQENVGGVNTLGNPPDTDPATVATGIEIFIGLTDLGWDGVTPVKIAGFITSPTFDFTSNQVIGGLPADTDNLGTTSAIDFSAIAGSQYASIGLPAADHEFDVMFLLDESSSITSAEWDYQKAAVVDCIMTLPLNSSTAVGVITFDDNAFNDVPLTIIDDLADQMAIVTEVSSLTQGAGGTDLLAPLQLTHMILSRDATGAAHFVLLSSDGGGTGPDVPAAFDALLNLPVRTKINVALLAPPCLTDAQLAGGANTPGLGPFTPGQPEGVYACVDTTVPGDYVPFCQAALCELFMADGFDCDDDGVASVCEHDSCGLEVIGRYDEINSANSVAINGSVAYVADSNKGLVIFDVSDPAAPAVLAEFDTPGEALDLVHFPFMGGDYVLIADGSEDLQIVDVSVPDAPVGTSSLALSGNAVDIARIGGLAIVVSGSDVYGVDVAPPSAPAVTKSWSSTSTLHAVGVHPPTGEVIVAAGADGLIHLDSTFMVATNFAPFWNDMVDVVQAGGMVYALDIGPSPDQTAIREYTYVGAIPGMTYAVEDVLAEGGGLRSMNNTVTIASKHFWHVNFNGPNPVLLRYAGTPGTVRGSAVDGDFVYGADSEGGFVILKCSSLCGPLPDINNDGVLNILDFVDFQSAFVENASCADCDGNGAFNVLDFVCFQGSFVGGCPL